MVHGPWKKPLDFGGNPGHIKVRVRVGLGLRLGGAPRCTLCVLSGICFIVIVVCFGRDMCCTECYWNPNRPTLYHLGYWRQESWREAWWPSPKGGSRSLQWSETGMEDPKRTLWQCTASVCVAGVHCWEYLLGVSRSMERDLLSVLSVYPRIFLRVFSV